jgi:general secretion pathway protein C
MPRALLQPLTSPTTLASGASAVLFIGVVGWWTWAFHATPVVPLSHPAPPAPLDAAAGATLFGAQPDSGRHDQVQLLGILAFDPGHAAAIVSVGGDPARVVPLKGRLDDSTTLSEVRAHSIVLDHDGIQREITLPAAANPDGFVR